MNALSLASFLQYLKGDSKEKNTLLKRDLTDFSAQVQNGDVFLALSPKEDLRMKHIQEAKKRGASLILSPKKGEGDVFVPNLSKRAIELADVFYNKPQERLKILGITGTNGKTTSAFLGAQLLDEPKRRASYLGTLGLGISNELLEESTLTTPSPVIIRQKMAHALLKGATSMALEVSSHALSQNRVFGLSFEGAIFTNLTPDHLDYHKSMKEYELQKRKLFEVHHPKVGIFNLEDPRLFSSYQDFQKKSAHAIGIGMHQESSWKIQNLLPTPKGFSLEVHYPKGIFHGEVGFLGRFNVLNLLGILAYADYLGIQEDVWQEKLHTLSLPKGRLESILLPSGVLAVIDYAHTQDALAKTLKTLKEHTQGKLFVVFGCGGDRDRSKRAPMGRAASLGADFAVLTSDNPRSEEPMSILWSIESGMNETPKHIEADRKAAILWALQKAKKGDVVLIAGKGHETYQIIGKKAEHFSDQEVVLSCR